MSSSVARDEYLRDQIHVSNETRYRTDGMMMWVEWMVSHTGYQKSKGVQLPRETRCHIPTCHSIHTVTPCNANPREKCHHTQLAIQHKLILPRQSQPGDIRPHNLRFLIRLNPKPTVLHSFVALYRPQEDFEGVKTRRWRYWRSAVAVSVPTPCHMW